MNLYKYILGIAFLFFGLNAMAQTQTADYYVVNSGVGKGVKLWGNNDSYKIHMGDASEYQYGPVTNYSIKTNMNGTTGRGWTWGIVGRTPIAALNNQGVFQTKGTIKTEGSLQTMAGYLYFGSALTQRLVGDNASALSWIGNHSTITQLIMKDKEGTLYGRLYGSGNGANFGLTDGDGNWSYLAVKDQYTDFKINNVTRMRLNPDNIEFRMGEGLDLLGNGQYWGTYGDARIFRIKDVNGTNGNFDGGLVFEGHTPADGISKELFVIRRDHIYSNLNFSVAGKVRIGDLTTPLPGNYGLYVPDGILSGEIVVADVSSSDWADDVFEKEDYDLMDVEERAIFITENKHLPYIPSAKEIEEDGLNVVEVMAGITRNVEEMNILMIQKEEIISQQAEEIQNLQQLLLEMNKRLEKLEGSKE